MLETSLELTHFLPVVYHSNFPLGEVLTIALFAIIFQGLFVLQQPSVLESPGLTEIASKSHPHIFSLGPLWYHPPQVGFPRKPILKQKLALRRFIREYSGIQHLWKGRDESRIGQRESEDVMLSQWNASVDHVRNSEDELTLQSVPRWSTSHLF